MFHGKGRRSRGGSSSGESQPSLSDGEGGKKKKKLGRSSVVKSQLDALRNFGPPARKNLDGTAIEEQAHESASSRPSEYATEKSSSEWGDGPAASDHGSVASFTKRRSTGGRSHKSAKGARTSQLGLPADPDAPHASLLHNKSHRKSGKNSEKDLGVTDIAVDLPPKAQVKQQQAAAPAKLGSAKGSHNAEADKPWPKNSARLDAGADGSGSDEQPASSGDDDSDDSRRVSKVSRKSDGSGW